MSELAQLMNELKRLVCGRICAEFGREDDAYYFAELETWDDEIIECCKRIGELKEQQ